MRRLIILAGLVFILCVPLFALSTGIVTAVNSSRFYVDRFEKYHVRESLARQGLVLSSEQMHDIAVDFIRYFNSNERFIELTVLQNGETVELFHEEEIIHFMDVKGLFVFNYRVFVISLVYLLAYSLFTIFYRKGLYLPYFSSSMFYGGVFTLGLMLLLGIGVLLDFDGWFYRFHLISFSNEFWSASGNMVRLFPQGFWIDAARYVVTFTAAIAVLFTLAGMVYRRWEKKKQI